MKSVGIDEVKQLYVPPPESHKSQNGRLLIIGGSHLFHAASLWALTVASRIVDLVHYSSVPENNELVTKAKEEFRNGIVVPRSDLDAYIEEDDCILIGPGMERDKETETLTNSLLKKYPNKQWVIDAGALQMLDVRFIPRHAILTPHHREFEDLVRRAEVANENLDPSSEKLVSKSSDQRIPKSEDGQNFVGSPHDFAKKYHCIVLLKGQKDIASDGEAVRIIEGGNAGMTKGGTGDVLAGLIAALACKNDPVLATIAGSFINKRSGEALYEKVGPYFNATDLANQIPITMKKLLLS